MNFDDVVHFQDVHRKRRFLTIVGTLIEPHEITIKPYRPRRSNTANRYWFGRCVKAFCQFQKDQGEHWTPERAHAFIVRNVLGEVEVTNKLTGETFLDRHETHNMDSAEFSDFIERGHAWLAEWGIIVETRREFEELEKPCPATTKQS